MNFKEILRIYRGWITSPISSIILGILLFFLWDVSIFLSILIILLGFFIPMLIILLMELKIRSNQLSNIRSMEREMNTVMKVLNSNGDVSMHSRIKIINRDKNLVIFLTKDTYTTPGSTIELLKPRIISSSTQDVSISERVKNYYDKEIKLDNKLFTHKYVECDYEINPPLRNPNDFVEYDLEISATGHAKAAWMADGEIDGFIVKSLLQKLNSQ